MNSSKQARIAGFSYLAVIVFGMYAFMSIYPSIIVSDDPVATATNILANETLFRVGFLCELALNVFWALLALILYRLLKRVDKDLALVMLAFGLLGVPIGMINALNHYAALPILSTITNPTFASVNQIQVQAMYFINLWEPGYDIAQVFYALFLVPLGYLVYKSEQLPNWLGVWLVLGGISGVIDTITSVLLPNYSGVLLSMFEVFSLSELAFCGWLLVKGVKKAS
jgi:hypothetical protein